MKVSNLYTVAKTMFRTSELILFIYFMYENRSLFHNSEFVSIEQNNKRNKI